MIVRYAQLGGLTRMLTQRQCHDSAAIEAVISAQRIALPVESLRPLSTPLFFFLTPHLLTQEQPHFLLLFLKPGNEELQDGRGAAWQQS